MSNKKILYITESTFNFSQVDSTSVLLTGPTTDLSAGVYHTSLGDMSVDQIIKLAQCFDEIKFEDRGFDQTSNVYKESVCLFRYVSRFNPNIRSKPNNFVDHPKIFARPQQPVIWVFGCSHSHGVGLRSNEFTYGEWLAQWLNLPLQKITKPGSSLSWSYRHLFNSNIEKHDTVIWQLTTPERVSQFNGTHMQEILLSTSNNRKLIDSITTEQLYFTQLTLLNTGVKYLRTLGCKFVIGSIIKTSDQYNLLLEYTKYPEYCFNSETFIDIGTDNVHAGPLSHKALAQRLLNHIQLQDD